MTRRLYSSILLSFHSTAALLLVIDCGVLSIQRTFWVWFCEHALYAQKDSLDVVDGRPLFFEDVETNVARHVDVWVVHWRDECDQGCGVGICGRECEGEFERETGVWLGLEGEGRLQSLVGRLWLRATRGDSSLFLGMLIFQGHLPSSVRAEQTVP
jgi:hypothetical protein